MSSFQNKVQPYTEQNYHPFVDISGLQDTGNQQLNLVTQRILAKKNILSKNEVVGVYLRTSSLYLEVFILVNHKLSGQEAKFWWTFVYEISQDLNEEIFKIGVGNPEQWERTNKRFGWKELRIY